MDIIMRGGVWCRGIYCGVVWIRQNSNTKRTIGLFSVKQHKNKGNKQLCYAVYILLILNSTRNIQHITQGQFKGSWASLWAQTFHIFYGRSLPPLGSTAALHAVPGRIKNRPTFHHLAWHPRSRNANMKVKTETGKIKHLNKWAWGNKGKIIKNKIQ